MDCFAFQQEVIFMRCFIAKLEDKEKLLEEKIVDDEELPLEERYISVLCVRG